MKLRTMFPVLGVVVALAGCSAETGQGSTAETASNAQSQAAATGSEARAPRGPHRGHGGPDFLVFAALRENIDLTAEQRTTIEGLVKKGRPAMPAPDKTRITALANAVRAGKVDAAALQPNRAATDEAMKAHVTDSAKKLSTLHATLTTAQRAALVDAIAAKAKGPRPEHARGHVKGEGHMRHGHGGPPLHMLEGLDLTEAQRTEIKTKLEASRPKFDREEMKAKHEEMKKAMGAKLQTFKADSFDANAFLAPPEGAFPKVGMADHMANQLATVVSVLNEAQREKLAQKIEQGPPARPEGTKPGRPAR